MGKVCSLAQEKKNALAAQKTVLQVAQKEIQLLTELVERNVESTSDQDLRQVAQAVAGIDLQDTLVTMIFTLFDENSQ